MFQELCLLTPKDVVNLIASAILIHSFEGASNGADGPQQSQNLFPRRNFCSFFAFSLSLAYDNHGRRMGNTVRDTTLVPTEEQLRHAGGAVEGVETAPLALQGGSHEVCSAHFAVVIEYKDQEQTTELRLPQDIIATLALEAEFRDMRIGELIGALIAATMEKDLLQLILDTEKGTNPQTVDLREIRISPMQV